MALSLIIIEDSWYLNGFEDINIMSLNGLRYSILVACVLQAVFVCGQNQTQIFDSEIKTLRIERNEI